MAGELSAPLDRGCWLRGCPLACRRTSAASESPQPRIVRFRCMPMRRIETATADEMVLDFLQGEIDSPQFGHCIQSVLGEDPSVVHQPRATPEENIRRRHALACCRGFEMNALLFRGSRTVLGCDRRHSRGHRSTPVRPIRRVETGIVAGRSHPALIVAAKPVTAITSFSKDTRERRPITER
jgi:hypothetical protein